MMGRDSVCSTFIGLRLRSAIRRAYFICRASSEEKSGRGVIKADDVFQPAHTFFRSFDVDTTNTLWADDWIVHTPLWYTGM